MNLSNLADLEALADLPHACVANDGTECICGDAPKLTPSQKGTVRAAVAALKEMDDTIRTQKREIDDLRAELDRRAQTIANLVQDDEGRIAAKYDRQALEVTGAVATAQAAELATLADVATDAYDALRALWPSEAEVAIVKVHLGAGAVTRDVKIRGRRLGAHLGLHAARDVARGLRKFFADLACGTAEQAASIEPTYEPESREENKRSMRTEEREQEGIGT